MAVSSHQCTFPYCSLQFKGFKKQNEQRHTKIKKKIFAKFENRYSWKSDRLKMPNMYALNMTELAFSFPSELVKIDKKVMNS